MVWWVLDFCYNELRVCLQTVYRYTGFLSLWPRTHASLSVKWASNQSCVARLLSWMPGTRWGACCSFQDASQRSRKATKNEKGGCNFSSDQWCTFCQVIWQFDKRDFYALTTIHGNEMVSIPPRHNEGQPITKPTLTVTSINTWTALNQKVKEQHSMCCAHYGCVLPTTSTSRMEVHVDGDIYQISWMLTGHHSNRETMHNWDVCSVS